MLRNIYYYKHHINIYKPDCCFDSLSFSRAIFLFCSINSLVLSSIDWIFDLAWETGCMADMAHLLALGCVERAGLSLALGTAGLWLAGGAFCGDSLGRSNTKSTSSKFCERRSSLIVIGLKPERSFLSVTNRCIFDLYGELVYKTNWKCSNIIMSAVNWEWTKSFQSKFKPKSQKWTNRKTTKEKILSSHRF